MGVQKEIPLSACNNVRGQITIGAAEAIQRKFGAPLEIKASKEDAT